MFRHTLIKSLMARSFEGEEDAIYAIWEPLGTQVISIVGETGFDSLYARSLFLTHKYCPWYILASETLPATERFMEIKMNLESMTPAQFKEGSSLQLITFTDILASLIGEQLTLRILYSAWSTNILDIVGKERANE